MPEKTEEIEHKMVETRARLAGNLDKLTSQTVGTVENVASSVQETVGAVQETVGAVKETVENITENVTGAVQNVSDTVSDTVGGVKETLGNALDIPGHVRNYPWLAVGGAVAVGYLVGSLLPSRSTSSVAEGMSAASGRPGGEPESWGPGGGPARGPTWSSSQAASSSHRTPDWLSGMFSALAPTFDKLKGLALGATMGIAREALAGSMSGELGQQVGKVFDDLTEKLGGRPIHSGLPGGPEAEHREGQKGHDHG